MVKWCNARSQKEDLTPCYTVGGADLQDGQQRAGLQLECQWLPAAEEAEWEKAARGGLSGQEFPVGQYDHPQPGELSGIVVLTPIRRADDGTFHPIYNDRWCYPYSSPVGSFAANGYGLYDMAGNMWEWCWDWYGSYAAGSQTDPRGAASGSNRVLRGGSWGNNAGLCRVANRDNSLDPGSSFNFFGFRIARSSVP